MSRFSFCIALILIIYLGYISTSNQVIAKSQNTILNLPVFIEILLQQDIKTHFVNLKIMVVNSSKKFSFAGKYGACNITYVIQQQQKQIVSYPGKSTRLGKTVTCPSVLFFMNLAPGERRIALEMQVQNRYFEPLRLQPGQYQFKGSFLMGGQIGTQKVSTFPLGPVNFTVK